MTDISGIKYFSFKIRGLRAVSQNVIMVANGKIISGLQPGSYSLGDPPMIQMTTWLICSCSINTVLHGFGPG